MDYGQALHYLYHQLPLFSNTGAKAYKADLKNTVALCNFLNNPQHKIKFVHVAGTNGKGSVSHMLAAVFQKNNYKTGLYTSPHLKDFRERIKINGAMIPQEFVVGFVGKTQSICKKIEPSFFELTFVMALDYFAHENIDVAIIETGLGGRLDSTNIIDPLLSIITNIGMDHVDILGNTLAKIAAEKAGIIKKSVPVVIGEVHAETKNVFLEKAKDTNSAITFAEELYSVISYKNWAQFSELTIEENESHQTTNYELDLNGIYQKKNLLTVLAALTNLKKLFLLEEDKIKEALSRAAALTGLQGRWEIIHRDPLVVLDVAHNEDGVKQLVEQISKTKYKSLHIVFGMVKDKDIEKVLENLPKKANYYFTKAPIPRALPEDELLEKAHQYHLIGTPFSQVNDAFKAGLQACSKEDMLIVCGSVFVVAEIDRALANEKNMKPIDTK